jgi:hypothetical protein
MRQPAVLFIHRYPGPLLGPGSVRSILGESLVKDQLLNMNHFRQRCMKARPDTPACTIQIAFVLLTRSGAPGGIRTPGLLVRRKVTALVSSKSRSENLYRGEKYKTSPILIRLSFLLRLWHGFDTPAPGNRQFLSSACLATADVNASRPKIRPPLYRDPI